MDLFPAGLANVSWTCQASPGATCPAPSGNGNLDATVDVPAGGQVVFTATANVVAAPPCRGRISARCALVGTPHDFRQHERRNRHRKGRAGAPRRGDAQRPARMLAQGPRGGDARDPAGLLALVVGSVLPAVAAGWVAIALKPTPRSPIMERGGFRSDIR